MPGSSRPDPPFPGAHAQVPGAYSESSKGPVADAPAARQLPLETTPLRVGDGWVIRLRVRAEEVSVSRETVVRERVVLRRREVDDLTRVQESVQREQLQLATEGELDVTEVVVEERPTRRPSDLPDKTR
ncbi:MAG: DUF2382 domain-containing protein [Chloroflexota bacterium]|nr:DUF2382 domain-containing protein [Chloroflexota bacterium]